MPDWGISRSLALVLPGAKLIAARTPRRRLLAVEAPLLALVALVVAISRAVTPSMQVSSLGLDLSHVYVCPFLYVTGVPDLFCGGTRSFLAMGGGDLGGAFVYHPLGPVLYAAMIGLGIVLAGCLAAGWQLRVRLEPRARLRLMRWAAVVVLLAWGLKMVLWNDAGLI